MNYPKEFEALINDKKNHYIGCGNPNAKILIIGKEPAIDKDKDNDQSLKQIKYEIDENRQQWFDNCTDKKGYDQLPDSYLDWSKNNPLFPYKGQKCMVRSEMHEKGGKEKDITIVHGDGGTSRTWIAYQKLYDKIAGNPPKGHEDSIDFHKYVFTSDLSDETAPMSCDTNPSATRASINRRNEMFNTFPDFPIIIVAAGHYPLIYGFDMEKTFNVTWKRQTLHVGRKFINVHYNKEHTRILLHTNQLSFYTNDLLDKLAELIRQFISEDLKVNNIKEFLKA